MVYSYYANFLSKKRSTARRKKRMILIPTSCCLTVLLLFFFLFPFFTTCTLAEGSSAQKKKKKKKKKEKDSVPMYNIGTRIKLGAYSENFVRASSNVRRRGGRKKRPWKIRQTILSKRIDRLLAIVTPFSLIFSFSFQTETSAIYRLYFCFLDSNHVFFSIISWLDILLV